MTRDEHEAQLRAEAHGEVPPMPGVYALAWPEAPDQYVYVGASQNLHGRSCDYAAGLGKYGRSPLSVALKERFRRRLPPPLFVVLARCESKAHAHATERKLIRAAAERGHPLLNVCHRGMA
jgi:hypothetical protein